MASRQAMVLVADEIYFNLHGKAILQGVYNSDLVINSDEMKAPQLVFYFSIETDLSEPFQSLGIEITFPGSEPIKQPVLVPPPQFLTAQVQANPTRSRWYTRHPVLIPAPVLRPGRIEVKVIHESGEIKLIAPWIINPTAQAAMTPKPN
jgi:hypothetical protein